MTTSSHPTDTQPQATADHTADHANAQDRTLGQPNAETERAEDGRGTDLRDSPMMAHLLDALEQGEDIGHYGRLVFTMVARFFLPEEEVIGLLARQPDQSETDARALVLQVKGRDYNPPKRERIAQWQRLQDFQILPSDDPNTGNVYDELRFPDEVYANIGEFWEEQAEAQERDEHSPQA